VEQLAEGPGGHEEIAPHDLEVGGAELEVDLLGVLVVRLAADPQVLADVRLVPGALGSGLDAPLHAVGDVEDALQNRGSVHGSSLICDIKNIPKITACVKRKFKISLNYCRAICPRGSTSWIRSPRPP